MLLLDYNYSTLQLQPAQLIIQLADKKEIAIISLTKTRQDRAVNCTDTNQPLDYKVIVKEKKKSVTSTIPNMYRQYIQIFKEELIEKVLLEYKPQDYKIKLQEGKTLTFRPIYRLLE